MAAGQPDPEDPDLGDMVARSRYPELARVLQLLGQQEFEPALDELRVLVSSPDQDRQPRAMLLLAKVYEIFGPADLMLRAYAAAADSRHPEVAPYAALLLGRKLAEAGDRRLARQCFRQAVKASDPDVRVAAETALDAIGPRSRRRGWARPRRS